MDVDRCGHQAQSGKSQARSDSKDGGVVRMIKIVIHDEEDIDVLLELARRLSQ